MTERDLILVGGGHTHALLIRMLAMQPMAGVRVTLVSDSLVTPYSGMLPGLVAGHYQADEVHIDLNQLCRWAGVRFIQGRITGLDPDKKRLNIQDQPDLHYDKVSFDTGSTPDLSIPGARSFAVGVKPVSQFYAKWQRLLQSPGSDQAEHWGVVGAGAGGIELVLAMAHRLRSLNKAVNLHLVHSGNRVLAGYPALAVWAAEKALKDYQVICHPNFRVSEVTQTGLTADNGNAILLDQAVWCTSAAAPAWPERSGLNTANGGFIAVNRSLQSTSHADIFAAGDIAEMVFDPRPKAGVYAVRQAPQLFENLRFAFLGERLRPINLQKKFLSLLSLGGKTAVGHRGMLVVKGDWVWRWKDRIDRAFMDRLKNLGPPNAMAAQPENTMHCAGCGSKLGPAMVSETLASLPLFQRPGVTPALAQAEDASAWQPAQGLTQLQSIDGFRAFSSDDYRLGQVMVNHALSDLYAMGAEPLLAQTWINLAFNHPRLQQRDFQRLMQGIAEALYQQEVTLAGGHSTEGKETHLALVANGEADASGLWRKTGARPGDWLVLTKPLGTGVILAADAAASASAASLDAAWASMLTSNRAVMKALLRLSPHAVTDITGYGLLGHLLEMLTDNTLQAELRCADLPALPGALTLLEAGWQSSLVPQLEPYLLQCQHSQPLAAGLKGLLLDPQTSGGLLVALAPEDWPLLKQQSPEATVIGFIKLRGQQDKAVQLIIEGQ